MSNKSIPTDTHIYDLLIRQGLIYDGVFMVHKRPISTERFTPMEEVVEIALKSGVKTHILHTKTSNPHSIGNPNSVVAPIEKANEKGADITMEFYPYHAFASYAMAFLPAWAVEGDFEFVMKNLSDPSIRTRLVEDAMKGYTDFMGGATPAKFTNVGNHQDYSGRDFEDIAFERNQSIGEMIVDVLYESELEFCIASSEPNDSIIRELLENDFMTLLMNPIYTVGSDAINSDGRPHPRAYGAISKIFRLGRKHSIPLETLV